MKIQTLIMVLAAVVALTGCTTFKPQLPTLSMLSSDRGATSDAEAEMDPVDYGTPVKMMAVWKDSTRSEPGQPAMRGFGGRIFLYDADGQPIRAEGELVIYGFDDSVKDREGSKADQKIVIKNHHLQQRYSDSGLGHSYSIWIDWDEAGGIEKSVTLVPFFRTDEGKIVRGGQAIYTLHSPNKDNLHKEKLVSHQTDDSSDDVNSVEHANFLQSDGEGNGVVTASGFENISESSKQNPVRTTTIRLPRETQRRIQESTPTKVSKNSSADVSVSAAAKASVESGLEATRTPAMQENETRSSRLEEARKKRRETIAEGNNVFGLPGHL